MDNPKVSIAVTSYKHANYLETVLNSIKAQTYPNIEVVIADDCSPDNSQQVILDWLKRENKPDWKTIFNKQNLGLNKTMNNYFNHVEGKYIKLIAADDYMAPTAIEEQVAIFEQLDDSYGVVYTDAAVVDENNNQLMDSVFNGGTLRPEGNIFSLMLETNRMPGLSTMQRLKVYKEGIMYSDTLTLEDYDLFLRIANKYKFKYIDKKLYFYRLHTDNMHKKLNLELERFKVLSANIDLSPEVDKILKSRIRTKYVDQAEDLRQYFDVYSKIPGKKGTTLWSFLIKKGLSYKFLRLIEKFGYKM